MYLVLKSVTKAVTLKPPTHGLDLLMYFVCLGSASMSWKLLYWRATSVHWGLGSFQLVNAEVGEALVLVRVSGPPLGVCICVISNFAQPVKSWLVKKVVDTNSFQGTSWIVKNLVCSRSSFWRLHFLEPIIHPNKHNIRNIWRGRQRRLLQMTQPVSLGSCSFGYPVMD